MSTRNSTIGSTTALFVGLLGATAVMPPARADATSATHSVTVRYTEQELQAKEGRQALEARLESAARAACGDVDRDLMLRRAARECRAAAVADAMARLDEERRAGSK